MSETLHIDSLSFEIRRSDRRRTFELTIERDGSLRVHSPSTAEKDEVEKWVRSKTLWTHRKLLLRSSFMPGRPEPEFVSGESFSFLGRWYRLRLINHQQSPLRLESETFFLRRADRGKAERHFKEWYRQNGLSWLTQRIHLYAPRVGVVPKEIRLRDLGYRWASCTRRMAILFNWRILQLPARLADYVIVHELTHLKESHHGPRFWRTLELALPDWKVRQQELKKRANEFMVLTARPARNPQMGNGLVNPTPDDSDIV